MARIRSVHPDICTDQGLVGLSGDAERLWVRLWTHLDDEGRCEDDPLLLKAALFPRHRHIGEDDIEEWLGELIRNGQVIRYEIDGVRCLTAKPEAWGKYQKPRRRVDSKLPAPPCADIVGTCADRRGQAPTGGVGGDVDGGETEMKMEGESEGETESRAFCAFPVDNVSPLEARAASAAQRLRSGHANPNPAAGAASTGSGVGVAGTNGGIA